ncbi:App1 family protein [Algoriphagus halophytocola]|uniref:DUF2183 domain-containing protein n=1 Tax=Algoriphagus halophytocola TaxID=2991499 RepID=A0ABY6MNP2_9BACT|nr:phosphatase domain-containing protein [Algoriphagus sp. TR-M5]UZD24316.1 DUF2183 domain-containing protein [Algoriphagus sp. TR-M5]
MTAKKGKLFLTIIYEIKLKVNQVILWVSIKLGLVSSILIVPYQGFSNQKELYLAGRVIRDNRVKKSTPTDRIWQNIDKMFRRFNTVVIPHVQVKALFAGQEFFTKTNEEGYFEFKVAIDASKISGSRWQNVELYLVDQIIKGQGYVTAIGKVVIPKGTLDFGVISDIDDTVVPTGAMRLTEMLKTTFAKNAYTRVPFAGVSALYKALEKGRDGLESNPFFYVSSSPWNLYDFLIELLEVHAIPKGPLMLRDIGLSRTELIAGSHEAHKLEQIRKILLFYPHLSFLLFGDSGQDDPEIYLQIVKEFPGRILKVFIRDIHASRHEFVKRKSKEMAQYGIEMQLVEDTLAATRIAIENGWILPDGLEDVAVEKAINENATE